MKISEATLRNTVRKIIHEQVGPSAMAPVPSDWPKIWMGGQLSDLAALPANVAQLAGIFAKIDPSKKYMYSFSVRQLKNGNWEIIRFGERYGHVRRGGGHSTYGSVGGDYTMINFAADEDDEERLDWMLSADVAADGGRITVKARGPLARNDGDVIFSGNSARGVQPAVKAWAAANLKQRGYTNLSRGESVSWSIEPMKQPGRKASTGWV